MKEIRRRFQASSGKRVDLRDFDPGWAGEGGFADLTKGELKARAQPFLADNAAALADAQERLYASDVYSVLVVLLKLSNIARFAHEPVPTFNSTDTITAVAIVWTIRRP